MMQPAAATMDDWHALLPARSARSTLPSAGDRLCIRHYSFDKDAIVKLPAISEHAICLVVGRTAEFAIDDGRRWKRRIYEPGEGSLIPAGTAVSFRVIGPAAVAHLYLSGEWFDKVVTAGLGFEPGYIRLSGSTRLRDPFLWIFMSALLRRLRLGPRLDRMVLDSATLGLACHLLREYALQDKFSKALTYAWEDAARVGDFIDELIGVELGLHELAESIGLPAQNLLRDFASADACCLRHWLEHSRIRRVHALLTNSTARLEEVALAAGIATPDALDVISYFAAGYPAAELRDLCGVPLAA
jgi:AraC-like DNA-binding protein